MKSGVLLIVDDEVQLADAVAQLFSDEGYTIKVAYSAADGLSILDREVIDCVVSDILMPRMNGIEFIKEVRKRKIEVPFIFYTGHGTEELMVQASIHGCFEFIDKPELVGLMEAVDRGILEGQQRRNPDRKTTLSNEEIDEFKAMINELKKKSN